MREAALEIDVLCVGHAAYDLAMAVDHHPGEDEKCAATAMAACGGGPAANAAVTVARLGGVSAFAGYLGNDVHGCLHFDELAREGVHTRWVARGNHPTPLSVILVKPNGDRTVVNHRIRTPVLSTDEIDFSHCRPKVILFDGHEPPISLDLAAKARAGGIPTVLDAGSVHGGTVDLLPLMDYVVASARFARDFTGESDPQRAVEKLGRSGLFAAVTLGEKGLVWKDTSTEARALPAYPVAVVDTTGADDAFHGAFALGLARLCDMETILRHASAAAALTCTRLGARIAIPTAREVDDVLGMRYVCPDGCPPSSAPGNTGSGHSK
jgi:sulfofructose kinase